MTKHVFFIGTILTVFGNAGCNDPEHNKASTLPKKTLAVEKQEVKKDTSKNRKENNLTAFLPKGYKITEKTYGDLNKDGLKDCVIIIKGSNKNNIIKDEYRGALDRNRRGLIVLLNRNGSYELAVKNYDCFSSENEDGGVYYPPELSVEIDKGKLYVGYHHGRYGYWQYTFRFQNSDFELIGYDATDSRGPVVNSEVSINYLTKKKIIKENINESADSGEEVFKETVTKIDRNKLVKLSEIVDFDTLKVSDFDDEVLDSTEPADGE